MDQFSHDLTVALQETSLLDRVSRWGQRRRTRSTGNLPCAPQPTEDSSSPTDMASSTTHTNTNVDGLVTHNADIALPSDSDDKEDVARLPCKLVNARLGALESDSLNETFSPARFFKSNARRKRKKRMSVEYEMGMAQHDFMESSALPGFGSSISAAGIGTGTIRKRVMKQDTNNRSNLFFCGKRKRSNRDRYHDYDHAKSHSSSMPRHTYLDEYRMRPRSFSSTTSKPLSDRLLPLNQGLVSKIEKISQLQKTDSLSSSTSAAAAAAGEAQSTAQADEATEATDTLSVNVTAAEQNTNIVISLAEQQQQSQQLQSEQCFHGHRKKSNHSRRRTKLQQLQFAVQHPMDCGELNDFLSSSSLSSSESDDEHTANDTDREGDDELTDWPGNEGLGGGLNDCKYDPKRKLTKKSTLPQIKSSEEGMSTNSMNAEDDTLMSASGEWSSTLTTTASSASNVFGSMLHETLETRYQPSEPITITATSRNFGFGARQSADGSDNNMSIPLKQIESEMSGETSNPFLSSPPCQASEVREIRAGCRRVKGERPGLSIKTSVNERLARFLQNPRQTQIRLPHIEIYEQESLINLATLYSLHMALDNGCAVLTKTSNTTQSVNVDQQSLQSNLLLGDFKRRCYDGKNTFVPRK